jgi:hypothetical protein
MSEGGVSLAYGRVKIRFSRICKISVKGLFTGACFINFKKQNKIVMTPYLHSITAYEMLGLAMLPVFLLYFFYQAFKAYLEKK